jgi:hypothetical protein
VTKPTDQVVIGSDRDSSTHFEDSVSEPKDLHVDKTDTLEQAVTVDEAQAVKETQAVTLKEAQTVTVEEAQAVTLKEAQAVTVEEVQAVTA